MGAAAHFAEQWLFKWYVRLQDPSTGLTSWEKAVLAECAAWPTPTPLTARPGMVLSLTGFMVSALCCVAGFLFITHVLNLKRLFGLDMFCIKTFTWAEKAIGFTGNTHVQFLMDPGSQWVLYEGNLDPCGDVSWMKISEVWFKIELIVRPARLLKFSPLPLQFHVVISIQVQI